ncbi:MAG: hypothetical protein K9L66_11000 [Spirochaetaceae bacterium]|nr:hypothetical protein [Spirochaetaceae bacterium]MCF7939620.1 hypothetical protein [Spirochaetales bacterium]
MSIVLQKGIIVPALFGVLFLILCAGYAAVFFIVPIPLLFKLIIAVGLTALAVAMVFVIIQRNKEIQEEKKDDLSKY